jgi:hypothetical protein
LARLTGQTSDGRWPPAPSDVETRVRRIHRRRSWHWHEHYNAACAYALPLLDESLTRIQASDTLAAHAVDQLKRATACAHSAYVASRRDWVLSEDPDLKALRGRHEFEEFQFLYLPSDQPVRCRPRNVQQLESSRYVRDLMAANAERWLQTWRAHARQVSAAPDTATLYDWFDDERRAWDGVREVALSFRHPRTRFALIDALRAGAARYGFARPAVPFPRYDDEPLLDRATCEVAYEAEIQGADDRLRNLATLAEKVVDDLANWQATLRSIEADGGQVPPRALAGRCVHHAALWQLLAHWLEARHSDVSDQAYAEFRSRVARVPLEAPAGNGAGRTNVVAVG